MKQLPMTPELKALIQKAVGEDVDPTNFAVFETIALNTKPLPGKRGTIFENAVIQPLTLKEMADSVNSPNGHLPLVADHVLFGAPKGRFFHAGLDWDDGMELRSLFYLDPTEADTITKLNSGTLDEVSVAFLSRELRCSECGWDYFAEGKDEHFANRTCANGHTIGKNGVHGEMIGLNQFIELSLVARGAADKPKIVGKSQARLAPTGIQALAANGFETDALVVQASMGKKDEGNMDLNAAFTQVATLSTEKGQLTAQLTGVTAERDTARTDVTRLTGVVAERDATIATLTTERDEARQRPEASVATERDEAVAFLHDQLDNLMVAKGEAKLEGDKRLTKVAELKAKISELTGNLTSILPVNGKSVGAGGADDKTVALSYHSAAAYGTRK